MREKRSDVTSPDHRDPTTQPGRTNVVRGVRTPAAPTPPLTPPGLQTNDVDSVRPLNETRDTDPGIRPRRWTISLQTDTGVTGNRADRRDVKTDIPWPVRVEGDQTEGVSTLGS